MRQAATAVAVGMLASTTAFGAQAQQLVLSDGSRYATAVDFYTGTWKWERPQPRQTAITRLGRDGSFFFHNLTNGLQHIGRYKAGSTTFTVAIERSCSDNGARCQSHEPPAVKDYPFQPVSADLFQAGIERWERQKSDQRPSM
jgi:hypothetical protein